MICIDAFKNLNIVQYSNSLKLSPCCYSVYVPAPAIDFENNAHLVEIRNQWKSNTFPSACANCKNVEELGNKSRRIASNEWYRDHGHDNTDVELIRLDYWVGDICNLRCATCAPHSSSAWKEELKIPLKKVIINQYWKNLNLDKLKFIHFNGGEPLLSKEHVVFLKSIPKKSQVQINYNTNGTVLPSAELLSLWNEFDLVKIDFSIDAIQDRFEYIRYPANWHHLVKNLQWFYDNCSVNCMFAVNTTVSLLNHKSINDLNVWLKTNFYKNRIDDPVEHRSQPATGLFSLKQNNHLTPEMIQFLDGCDLRRGTNWRQVFPELANSV
jgi:sulfatase maturation enzyme AslB (radical SAM superfamily)